MQKNIYKLSTSNKQNSVTSWQHITSKVSKSHKYKCTQSTQGQKQASKHVNCANTLVHET